MSITAERVEIAHSATNGNGKVPFEALSVVSSPEEEEDAAKKRFQNSGEYAEWKIRAKLGIYPEDHIVSQFAQRLLQRVGGAPDTDKPGITVYKGHPNTFIFPDGSVYLSDQLLRLVDNEEELLFVLMHERIHHIEAHSEKVFERGQKNQEVTYGEILFGNLGQMRIHEWEGDVKAFLEVDKQRINPTGGIDMMEKFRTDPRLAGGLVHGKSTDRALNLRTLTHIKDLASIEEPLNPIPQEVKDAIDTEQTEGQFSSKYDQFMKLVNSGSYFKALDMVETMDLNNALVTLQGLVASYWAYSEKSERPRDRWYQLNSFQRTVIPHLGKKIWEGLAESTSINGQTLSTKQNTLLFYTVLDFTIGLDSKDQRELLFHQVLSVSPPDQTTELRWTNDNFSLENQIHTASDLKDILGVLDPQIYESLGLKFKFTPEDLVRKVVNRAIDECVFDFEDGAFKIDDFLIFSQQLTGRLAQLYQQHGAEEFNEDDIFRHITEEALGYLNNPDKPILLQRAQNLRPDAFDPTRKAEEAKRLIEKEYSDKLVNVFRRLAQEVKEARDKKEGNEPDESLFRNVFWRKNRGKVDVEDVSYLDEVRQIFQERQLQTPQDLLVFLANFRKNLQEDSELWGAYLRTDDQWIPLMERVISENPALNTFTSPQEKTLFDFKVALLIAYDFASNNLQDPWKQFHGFMHSRSFNLDWYRAFHSLATKEDELANETGVAVSTGSVLNFAVNEEWLDILKEGKYMVLMKALRSPSKARFSEIVDLLTNEFPFDHYGDEKEHSDEGDAEGQSVDSKRKFLNEVFKKYQFDLSNPLDLRTLYYLSTYLEDHSLAVRVQGMTWERLAPLLTFEEGFAFLEKELGARRLLSLKAVSDFVEINARTHDQIDLASQKLLDLLTQESSFAEIGKLIMKEQLLNKFFDNKYELLLACIGNGEDDGLLKRYLYQRWVSCMDYDRQETVDNIHPDSLMHRLYRLDPQSKYVMVRDLLTGDKGVLTENSMADRLAFVNFFLDNYVEVTNEEEAKFFKVIKEIMEEVVRTANYDLLYFAIAPILQERILIPPSNQISWLDVIRTEVPPPGFQDLGYEYGEDTDDNVDDEEEDDGEDEAEERSISLEEQRGRRRYYAGLDREARNYDDFENDLYHGMYRERADQQEEAGAQPQPAVPHGYTLLPDFTRQKYTRRVDENDVNSLYKYITGSSEEHKNRKSERLLRQYEDIVDKLLGNVETKPVKQKMTVNEFILEMAQKLGAPGVRFLQLIGQYVELPPNLEQAFNQVYDKVEGQSKITADQTLLREWAEARERVVGMLERLGGGSLMSVFRTESSDGADLALKILNPNSGHHTETTYKLLTTVFTALSQRDPAFAPSIALLQDIREWIRGDIDFTGFTELDRRFRQKHEGYSAGGRYAIKVPVSRPPENKYFAQEEFVDGTNLTEIDKLQEQGHDLREVVSLVTKDFLEQVKDGLVHSDIHPGNIRVTSDNKVALLDRNYYIQLSLQDRFFVGNLSRALSNTSQAAQMCIDYIGSTGVQIDEEKRQRVIQQAQSLNQVPDPTDRLMRLAVLLRKEDIRFPIKITLLVKDLFYLDRFAKKVGYSGIAEAGQ